MEYTYKTHGTCSQYIYFDVTDGLVHNVRFIGGCNGNLKALGILVEGQPVDEVINKLEGVRCETKPTSCAHQLTCALKETKANK